MNFVCDKCKQKYHVADEKIRGRAVTRFRCKKCENVIELRADALPDPDAPGAPKQADAPDDRPRPATMAPISHRPAVMPIGAGAASAARPAGRPRAATSVGVAFNAGMAATAAKPAPRTASTSAILNASETGWYAGIRDLPVGPLTRKELVAKVQSAEVTPDTLVWREGLDDWRPLRNVAELGDVLRLGAQRISGNLLDEMGRRPPSAAPVAPPAEARRSAQVVPLRQPLAAPSAPSITRPAMTDDDEEEATRVTGMDPAIAALVPRALGLEPRPAPKETEDSGDHTLIEPPHSPMNRALHLEAPVKDAVRPPAPRIAPPAKAPPPPTRPSSPKVPAASFLQKPAPAAPPPAPLPPAIESVPPVAPAMSFESSPALQMSSMPAPAAVSSMPPAASADPSLPPEDELPEDLFGRKPLPPPSKAPSLESFGLSAAFASGPPPASMPAPALTPVGSFQPGPAPMVALSAPAPAVQRPGGLSLPVVILMVGVLVLGVFGGVVLAGRLNHPAPQPVPPPVPIAMPTAAPAPTPAAPTPEVAVAAPEVAPTTNPPVDEPETPGNAAHRSGHHSVTTTPREPAGTISAAQREANARALAAMNVGGTGPSGGPVNTTRLPTNTASQDNAPAQTGAARNNRAVRAFQDAHVVANCWQTLLRQNPALHDSSVRITLSVNGLGRFSSASVAGSPDPRFNTCISSSASRVAPIGAGESFDTIISVSLSAGN